MRISFTSVAAPELSIEEMIDFAAEVGYDAIELRCDYPEDPHAHGVSAGHREVAPTTSTERDAIVDRLERTGVDICLLGTSCAFAHADPDRRTANEDEAIEYASLAASLGVPFVRVFGGALPEELTWEEGRDHIVASLERVCAGAAEHDVSIMFEQHDEWDEADVLVDIVTAVDADNLGILWHLTQEQAPLETMDAHLKHLHVREYGLFMADLVALLDEQGYDGYLSYERGTGEESLRDFHATVRPMLS